MRCDFFLNLRWYIYRLNLSIMIRLVMWKPIQNVLSWIRQLGNPKWEWTKFDWILFAFIRTMNDQINVFKNRKMQNLFPWIRELGKLKWEWTKFDWIFLLSSGHNLNDQLSFSKSKIRHSSWESSNDRNWFNACFEHLKHIQNFDQSRIQNFWHSTLLTWLNWESSPIEDSE
jgi:hypothetical protein